MSSRVFFFFHEKRSVFERTRVKEEEGGGESLYKRVSRVSESCVKNIHRIYLYTEGYLEAEIKLLSRYKYFIREFEKNVASLDFSCDFSRLYRRRVISSFVRKCIVILSWTFRSRFAFAELCQNFRRAANAISRKYVDHWVTGSFINFSIVLTFSIDNEDID